MLDIESIKLFAQIKEAGLDQLEQTFSWTKNGCYIEKTIKLAEVINYTLLDSSGVTGQFGFSDQFGENKVCFTWATSSRVSFNLLEEEILSLDSMPFLISCLESSDSAL